MKRVCSEEAEFVLMAIGLNETEPCSIVIHTEKEIVLETEGQKTIPVEKEKTYISFKINDKLYYVDKSAFDELDEKKWLEYEQTEDGKSIVVLNKDGKYWNDRMSKDRVRKFKMSLKMYNTLGRKGRL